MYNLSGEYEVKLDDKSRLRLPSNLMKLLGSLQVNSFVVNRGFEKCLILYPQDVWEEKTKEVNQLNPYNIKNREFARFFYRGATQVEPDASMRILIPKSLQEHALIESDVMLLAYHNQIEIWSKEEYLKMVKNEPLDFASLAEEVFRHKDV
ncbi:MAG: division/cell wall cluster transcriptional repressor MraZ [Saprospiraceae bacterium]|nr:division/cell wall cluster transcriptional repressor MraZ [Saprospiraceae bacterium]MBK7811260.1 division/cell wall cluster transcriptional repressor MraZ [Saprospiraceae bacterium]MBK9631039.1 division/cell wall cluster transcriptional repressor MraZ [Saprospiraceae bacterium]